MNLASIIVPCFNQGQYLAEALDSVLAQTYQKWECIVVNDGSDDNTEIVALDYCKKDNRFRYFSKSNGGLASARNFGIKHANGKYVLPLDADDKISAIYLEKAVDVLDKKQEIKIVYGKAQFFGHEQGAWEQAPYDFRTLLMENLFYCTSLFRMEDYAHTKGYDESMKDGFEDWDFWITLLKNGGAVEQLPLVCFYYRKKETSMFHDLLKDKKRLFSAYLKLYNNQVDAYEKYFDAPQVLIWENIKLERVIKNYQQSFTYRMGLKLSLIKNTLFRFNRR